MSVYLETSKSDQRKIRKEMLVQAELMLAGLYPSKAQRSAAARKMVDKALAKERTHDQAA